MFVSRMPKMCAIPQSSAPFKPNILGGATHNVSTVTDKVYE